MNTEGELQVVEFGVGGEVFAVPVGLVREILDYHAPYHVPNGPGHFLGLTDVRGQGVPTVDFRRRFSLPQVEPTLATRILILDLVRAGDCGGSGGHGLTLGVVIDRVLGVSSFEAARVEPAPDIGVRWDSAYITGVIRRDGGFVVIIDVTRVFTDEVPAFDLAAGAYDFD